MQRALLWLLHRADVLVQCHWKHPVYNIVRETMELVAWAAVGSRWTHPFRFRPRCVRALPLCSARTSALVLSYRRCTTANYDYPNFFWLTAATSLAAIYTRQLFKRKGWLRQISLARISLSNNWYQWCGNNRKPGLIDYTRTFRSIFKEKDDCKCPCILLIDRIVVYAMNFIVFSRFLIEVNAYRGRRGDS